MPKVTGGFKRSEVNSIYTDPDDRYVVSLVVSYNEDDCTSPKQAAAAALALTTDDDAHGTIWYVFDRKTNEMHMFHQSEFQEEHVP